MKCAESPRDDGRAEVTYVVLLRSGEGTLRIFEFSARTDAAARRILRDVIPASALPWCKLVASTGFIRDNSHVVIK